MVTLDGIDFHLTGFQPVSTHRSTANDCMGSTRNPINDMGYGGLVHSVSGFVTTQADYDDLMDAIMSEGHHSLVIDTGWQYRVHSTRKSRNLAIGYPGYYPFAFTCITEDPFIYSIAKATRTKSITSNGQQWSADDSSNDIITSGNYPARPTIVLTAGAGSGYGTEGDTDSQQDNTYQEVDSTSYVLSHTHTFPATTGKAWRLDSIYFEADTDDSTDRRVVYKVTVQAASLNGGVETIIVQTAFWGMTNGDNEFITHDVEAQAGNNEDLIVRYYFKDSPSYTYAVRIYDTVSTATEMLLSVLDDVVIYNTADDTVRCNVCGLIHPGTIITINPDGTGSFSYEDDFSGNKSLYHSFAYSGCTYDSVSDKLDIADDGYIYYRIETYYPIVSIPLLTALITTTGSPTIQIAKDDNNAPGTWYDITTAIASGSETGYELKDSEGNAILDHETQFWIRIDCTGDGTNTASISSLALDMSLITIDAQIPLINTGSTANTFRCDQNGNSSVTCTISLQYEDRKWA